MPCINCMAGGLFYAVNRTFLLTKKHIAKIHGATKNWKKTARQVWKSMRFYAIANIDRIVEPFAASAEEAHFSHLADYDEIAGNSCNLSVSTCVEQEDKREKIDIVKLNVKIETIVAREQILRNEIVNSCVHNLTWTHFRSPSRILDEDARVWYMSEAAHENWNVRTLDRSISTQYI